MCIILDNYFIYANEYTTQAIFSCNIAELEEIFNLILRQQLILLQEIQSYLNYEIFLN